MILRKVLPLIIALILLIAGCQPNPESDVIIEKNNSWINKVNESKLESINNVLPDDNEEISFESESGIYHVSVNAKYHIPDVEVFPVVNVSPCVITQSKIDAVIKALFDGEPLYKYREVMTKTEIEDYLVVLKQRLALAEKGDTNIDEPIESIETAIKKYEILYLTAPEHIVDEKIETNLDMYDEENIIICGQTMPELMKKSWITIYSSESDLTNNKITYGTANNIYSSISRYTDDIERYVDLVGISQEDCLAVAESFLDSLDITEMNNVVITPVVCLGSYNESTLNEILTSSPKAYRLDLYRVYKDIPITIDDNFIGKKEFNNQYSTTIPYENISLIIDDTGIIQLKIYSLLDVQDEFCENSPLLDEKSMIEIANTYLPIKCQERVNDDITGYNLNITDIYLGYMRVKISNEKYMLVPVWDFYGNTEITYINPETDLEETIISYNYETASILTINAIDGTVIDREYGY